MKIEVIVMMYQEATLAPLFLDHYSFANKISVLLDVDTTDNTKGICNQFPNAEVHPFKFPDMMDDEIKQYAINRAALMSKADWLIVVDADEFVFNPDLASTVPAYLSVVPEPIVYADMWQIYRHKTEKPIDSSKPALLQRRHGDPDTDNLPLHHAYKKPCVVRGGFGIQWIPGVHMLTHGQNLPVSKRRLKGTHWAMADADLAIQRRIYGRKLRQSQNNLKKKLSFQNHEITEEQIKAECNAHENDPKLF
jgi:hypothetical protein